MKRILFICTLFFILLPGCFSQASVTPKTMEQVTFTTSDGVTIYADYLAVPTLKGAKKAALLLHMMPATRVSFHDLQNTLHNAGISSLAIDLRGHGQSTKDPSGNLNYQNFNDSDHQKSSLDVDAALKFLNGKGFHNSAISFVGASIGANLSLDALARYSELPAAVLLSPGSDYRGVKTDTIISKLGSSQKVWLVATEGDTYSADSVRQLHTLMPSLILTVFKGSEHGTNMFQKNPSLIPDIVKFLQ